MGNCSGRSDDSDEQAASVVVGNCHGELMQAIQSKRRWGSRTEYDKRLHLLQQQQCSCCKIESSAMCGRVLVKLTPFHVAICKASSLLLRDQINSAEPIEFEFWVEPWSAVAVCDCNHHCVKVVRRDNGSLIRTIGRQGSADGQFKFPRGVAFDNNSQLVVVADTGNNRLQVFRVDGSHVRTIGCSGDGPAQFARPSDVAFDEYGLLVVSDTENHRLQVLQLDGSHVRTIGSHGSGPGQFDTPRRTIVRDGKYLVADEANNRIQLLESDGTHVRSMGTKQNCHRPWSVELTNNEEVLVCANGNNRLQLFRLHDGQHLATIKSTDLVYPRHIIMDREGNIIVTDNNRVQVLKVETTGNVSSQRLQVNTTDTKYVTQEFLYPQYFAILPADLMFQCPDHDQV